MKTIPAAVVFLALSLVSASAQGTAFTYQGRLTDNGQPANGRYNFRFLMFDAATNGNQQGVTAFGLGVPVSNGLFSVKIDFGVLPPADRWLEIWVRVSTTPGFTILSPRQKLTPTPYSITAGNLSGTLPSSQLTGTVPLALLPGVVVTNNQSGLTFTGTFSGSGAGLTNVNADTAVTAATLQGLGDQQYLRTNWPGAPQGSFYRDWTRRQNTSPYNLNNDGAWTVVADTPDNYWATNYVTLTNFPGIDGSCVFVARSNNFNVPSLYWTFTNLDNIRGIDVEVLWVTNGANSSALGYSRSLNITFSERTRLFESNLYSLSGANGGHFNFHADSVQLGIFTNIFTTLYTEEDYLGRKWMNTWDNKENEMCNFTPRHGSVWHCGFEFMSPTTIRVYSGPNEWIRSLDLFTSFDRVRSFWLESVARYPTNLSITACPRSVTVFTHQKNTWPRWFYVTTNGMVLKQTVITN